MKIIVSQLEYVRPPRGFVFDTLERAYYRFLAGHEVVPVPNIIKVPDNDYDCLILTGGPDSVARNQTENLLYHDAVAKGKPIVGICHGAFVINDICKGTNGQNAITRNRLIVLQKILNHWHMIVKTLKHSNTINFLYTE